MFFPDWVQTKIYYYQPQQAFHAFYHFLENTLSQNIQPLDIYPGYPAGTPALSPNQKSLILRHI